MSARNRMTVVLTAVLSGAGATFPRAQAVHVDEPAVCYECHAEIEAQKAMPHVHAAFEDGECSACHNPHASKHAALLGDDQVNLCLQCHDDVGEELGKATVHEPAAAGQCAVCHNPHAAEHSRLLRTELAVVCQGCHGEVEGWLEAAVVHGPVDDGDCTTCHTPHGGGNPSLLVSAVPALCFDCHEVDAAFTRVHGGDDVSGANCAACHDPHASSLANLVRPNQHAPFAAGNCAACHGQPGERGSFAIPVGMKQLCTKCHRGLREAEELTYKHNLEDRESCIHCHNAHTSNTTFLLAAEQRNLCTRCHFNQDGAGGRSSMMTHEGVDCSACHLPHGANNSRYLKTLDSSLCSGCHEAAHRSSHPIGEDVIDQRTGNPVTCLSCHQLHGAEFDKYLPLDPSMDLCIQCHRR